MFNHSEQQFLEKNIGDKGRYRVKTKLSCHAKRRSRLYRTSEGVNLDTTFEGKIVGIDILDATEKIDIKTILSYTLELDKRLLSQKIA
mgnify:CR=1 FL=1